MTKVTPDRVNSRICAIDFTCSYKILKMFSSVTENILYSSDIFVLLANFRKGYFLLSVPEHRMKLLCRAFSEIYALDCLLTPQSLPAFHKF